VYVRDRATGTTTRASVSSTGSQGDAGSFGVFGSSGPDISRHGRYVAFQSEASNLVSGDTNHNSDVFLRDTAP
jgi:hypothetical protein